LNPNGTWTATKSLRTVVQEVTKLIDEPSMDDIQHAGQCDLFVAFLSTHLNLFFVEAASLWDTNKDEYKRKASEIFNKNCSPRD
jgi:ubiquitin-protein ligase